MSGHGNSAIWCSIHRGLPVSSWTLARLRVNWSFTWRIDMGTHCHNLRNLIRPASAPRPFPNWKSSSDSQVGSPTLNKQPREEPCGSGTWRHIFANIHKACPHIEILCFRSRCSVWITAPCTDCLDHQDLQWLPCWRDVDPLLASHYSPIMNIA